MDNSKKIHFVYLGEKLPVYAWYSLKLAHFYSGCRIFLIGNGTQKKQVDSSYVEFIELESFYDESEFETVIDKIKFSKDYKNGFWLKTLERFFVLLQFMKKSNAKEIFHAELDQLLFRSDFLIENLRNTNMSGVFYPLHSEDQAVASIFYCNKKESLQSLINYSIHGPKFDHEMELLAKWAELDSSDFFKLPTLSSLVTSTDVEPSSTHKNISFKQIGGIVDAAQLGQWVGGIDPKLIPPFQIPKTHFVDLVKPGILTKSNLKNVKFKYDQKNHFLKVSFGELENLNLYNLHLHSKIHKWVYKSTPSLKKFIKLANSKNEVKLAALLQQQLFFIFKSVLKQLGIKIKRYFQRCKL